MLSSWAAFYRAAFSIGWTTLLKTSRDEIDDALTVADDEITFTMVQVTYDDLEMSSIDEFLYLILQPK